MHSSCSKCTNKMVTLWEVRPSCRPPHCTWNRIMVSIYHFQVETVCWSICTAFISHLPILANRSDKSRNSLKIQTMFLNYQAPSESAQSRPGLAPFSQFQSHFAFIHQFNHDIHYGDVRICGKRIRTKDSNKYSWFVARISFTTHWNCTIRLIKNATNVQWHNNNNE